MIKTEDLKKLGEYLKYVFKDVFLTKADGKALERKVDKIQNSLDAVLKDKLTRDQEATALGHRIGRVEEWADKASPKVGIEFKR